MWHIIEPSDKTRKYYSLLLFVREGHLWDVCSEFNTLRPRQNGRHFADDNYKHIFLNENVRISIIISLKFVPKGPINNIPALVQIMAWRRPGDKPLSEPMMVRLPTHICVTRPQWVKPHLCPTLAIVTSCVISCYHGPRFGYTVVSFYLVFTTG